MDLSVERTRATKGYRATYTSGRGYGRSAVGDEAFDSSINFGDEVSFGDAPLQIKGGSHTGGGGGHHQKTMVDVFLAEDAAGEPTDHLPVGMQPTERGSRTKKFALYLCLAAVFVVIFITAPIPGFMRGHGKEDSSNASDADAPTPAPEILIEEDSGTVSKPAESEGIAMTEGIHVDMNRPQAIEAFIIAEEISIPHDLNRDDSPQAKALSWIAATDEAEVDIPEYEHNKHNDETLEEQAIQLLQRYALACLYFSMEATAAGEQRKHERRLQSPSLDEEDNRRQFDSDWTSKASVCAWFGVTCDDDLHVTALNLTHTRLSGHLVPEIFQEDALPFMTTLDLSHNSFQGGFPSQPITNDKLEVLHLEHNQIEGTITPVIEQLNGLVQLDLQANKFNGELPEDWFELSDLTILKLAANHLKGSIPAGMRDLYNIEWLELEENQLTGTIPTVFEAMKRIHTIKLAHNQISGKIPAFLGNLRLAHLSLEDNRISGEVPTSLGKLTSLRDLHLQLTDLTGTMPEEICALTGDGKTLQSLTSDCQEVDCSCCTECF